MKKLRKWWVEFWVKAATSYLRKYRPYMIAPQIDYLSQRLKKMSARHRVVSIPKDIGHIPEEVQAELWESVIAKCADDIAKSIIDNELVSIYVTSPDGNPEVLDVFADLYILIPRDLDDPRYRALTRTLSGEGHPYRIFPQ